ncbi:MAG: hypothetical protein RBS57_00250 [Desulforhabdus sp.]|jgi:hypothetical protein|nr:hypothetical protein [Desulforhabdus sp.]
MKQILLTGEFNEDEEILKILLHLLFPACRVEIFECQQEDCMRQRSYGPDGSPIKQTEAKGCVYYEKWRKDSL